MIGIHAILSTDTAVVPLAVDVDDDEDVDVDVDADVVAGVDVVVERTNSEKGIKVFRPKHNTMIRSGLETRPPTQSLAH